MTCYRSAGLLAYNGYNGIDADPDTSLFEYGLLVKDYGNDLKVIYGVETKESEYGDIVYCDFDTAIVSKEDIGSIINESWFDKKGFFSYNGMSEKGWSKVDYTIRIYDLIHYYGYENIF